MALAQTPWARGAGEYRTIVAEMGVGIDPKGGGERTCSTAVHGRMKPAIRGVGRRHGDTLNTHLCMRNPDRQAGDEEQRADDNASVPRLRAQRSHRRRRPRRSSEAYLNTLLFSSSAQAGTSAQELRSCWPRPSTDSRVAGSYSNAYYPRTLRIFSLAASGVMVIQWLRNTLPTGGQDLGARRSLATWASSTLCKITRDQIKQCKEASA